MPSQLHFEPALQQVVGSILAKPADQWQEAGSLGSGCRFTVGLEYLRDPLKVKAEQAILAL
jgi:hypothetical protein